MGEKAYKPKVSVNSSFVALTTLVLRFLSAVKAGSVFFGRICTSVVNLAPASTRASAFI